MAQGKRMIYGLAYVDDLAAELRCCAEEETGII